MTNLKELRKAKGLTQLEVAKQVGVSMTTYQLWERGAMNPTEENKHKLEQVFTK